MDIVNCEEKKDEELVSLSLEDQGYFLCLIKRYEDKILRYIKRISGVSEEEAEDILQEIFIKVYVNLNGFDKDLKFSSWIYRIVHNQVINAFRKNKARPQIAAVDQDYFLEQIMSDMNLVEDIDKKIQKNNILNILAEIKDDYREILILKFLEEKDYREISDILKKPMGTVASIINRAKKQFREKAGIKQIKF